MDAQNVLMTAKDLGLKRGNGELISALHDTSYSTVVEAVKVDLRQVKHIKSVVRDYKT